MGALSWPVEVGWAFAASATGPEPAVSHPVVSERAVSESAADETASLLIRPHQDWSMSAWDPAAERLHGLALEELERAGRPVAEVCAAMNAALTDASVYSDAPDWDGFWLLRLFKAAGVKPRFELSDFGRLMRSLVGGRDEALFSGVDDIAPRRHRAAADALHLKTLYDIARRAAQTPS